MGWLDYINSLTPQGRKVLGLEAIENLRTIAENSEGIAGSATNGRRKSKRELQNEAAMMQYQHQLEMEAEINRQGAKAAALVELEKVKGEEARKTLAHKAKIEREMMTAKMEAMKKLNSLNSSGAELHVEFLDD